jgi:hypothetical protein
MPNWVFNSVVISGEQSELDKLQAQLNQPVTKHFPKMKFNHETNEWESTPDIQHYSNPVFSFWNVVAPTDLEAYYGKEKEKIELDNFMEGFKNALAKDTSWYWWNNRNWETKWDIAVADGEQFPNTILEITDDNSLMYRFETAWSPVYEIFNVLAEQYPTLEFDYEYEEEQGWGGKALWENGEMSFQSEYDIPYSHADYVERGKNCMCDDGLDVESAYYEDCPIDKDKYEFTEDGWVDKEVVGA